MKFADKYTTLELISLDKEHIEEKKITITMDTYAQCEMLQEVFNKLEHLRLSLLK